MQDYNTDLAHRSLEIAEEIWNITRTDKELQKVMLAVELLRTTKEKKYSDFLVTNINLIAKNIARTGWIVGPALSEISDENFTQKVREAVKGHLQTVQEQEKKTPYGMPYEPDIWGAGWGIQDFGVKQYFSTPATLIFSLQNTC